MPSKSFVTFPLNGPIQFNVGPPPPPGYTFKYFISPNGIDTNDGMSPVQGTGIHGPWSLGSLLDAVNGGPNNQQKANNSAMASQIVGVVGDHGPLTLSTAGVSYPLTHGGDGMVLSVPSGTFGSPTVLASCNSAGQYVRGLGIIDGECNGTQISSLSLLGRFSSGTDCQYIVIDGLEVRNGMNGGIVLGQTGSTPLPGWVAQNNFVHHIYNCNEGFAATGCSQSGFNVTIGTVTRGTVYVNPTPGANGDQLFGLSGSVNFIRSQVSGVPGGAGVYTSSVSASIAGPVNCTGSLFAGSNTAGISFHIGDGLIIQNNFIQDIIDLNTALPNNQRVVGIKNWGCINDTVQFNTIYATVATGYPTGGIEHKNVPQYNDTIRFNYVHLANAVNFTGVDVISIAGDGEGPGKPIPPGGFHTINNNIFVANPNGIFGYPGVAGGDTFSSLLVNFYANTLVAVSGHGGWTRFGAAGQRLVDFHDNIIDRVTPPAGGNGGDWRENVDVIAHIDFNLYPPNYLFTTVPSGVTSPMTQYSASPPQNGGINGLMTALSTASGGATQGLESNGGAGPEIGIPIYANASGTKLKSSDYQLAPGSPGQGKGRIGGVPGGAVVDKGAWGGQTQIGCNFKDPSG